MPVVGFHQARRPHRSVAERWHRALAWPRPGGIVLAMACGAAIFAGSLSVGASAPRSTSAPAAAAPSPSPGVPSVATAPATPSPTPQTAAATAPTQPPPPNTPPAVAGAGAKSPLPALADSGVLGSDAALLDVSKPSSPLVLVNKRRALNPLRFEPSDLVVPKVLTGSTEPMLLRSDAAAAAGRMFVAAQRDGVSLEILSSYRSYATQVEVYGRYVSEKGVSGADETSARPGYSEHQTGLAMDVGDAAGRGCDLNSCFAQTAAGRWLEAHAAEHGFIIRYRPGAEAMTGYAAEPWHLRFVGAAVAQDLMVRGFTSYEAYLDVPAAPNYQ